MLKEADLLYNSKEDPKKILKACDIYYTYLQNDDNNYEACWKYGRCISFIGEFYPKYKWEHMYETALVYTNKATLLEIEKPEGFLWHGIMIGREGQEKGIMKSLKNLKQMKNYLFRSIEIDENLESGLAYRVLGRLYYTLPKIVGGNIDTSIEFLKKSLLIAEHPVTLFYLADSYEAKGDKNEAISLLDSLCNIKSNSKWKVETEIYKDKAEAKLNELAKVEPL